jgi:hypothetical protein
MRLRALCVAFVAALVVSSVGCGGTGLFRQYEYEEEVYLSLDGSATVYVNSSLAALNALRGTSFDTSPAARFDRDAVARFFSSDNTRVGRVSQSRRNNRRFAHVRLDVSDIRRLGEAAPFAWSRYQFMRDGDLFKYLQVVGQSAGKAVGDVGWNGRELVAFRLHLPSKIRYHNTGEVGRGNILVWEQPLADRVRGLPLGRDGLGLDARMDARSILYTTLQLFAVTFLVVAVTFGVILWWVMRRGGRPPVEEVKAGRSGSGGSNPPDLPVART